VLTVVRKRCDLVVTSRSLLAVIIIVDGPQGDTLWIMSTPASHRLFICDLCKRQTSVCRPCDRGQRYCGPKCAKEAHLRNHREANRRYQATGRGRELHRERQARYRARRRASQPVVTDRGHASRPNRAPSAPRRRTLGLCCRCGSGPVEFFRLETGTDRRPARRGRRRRNRLRRKPRLGDHDAAVLRNR